MNEIATNSQRKGFNPIVGDMYLQQEKYLSWYRGSVNDFHFYKRNVNGKTKQFEMLTMNLPKKAVEAWTSLIWNTRCGIKVNTKTLQDRLDDVLYRNNFYSSFGGLLEKAFALGNGFIIEYIANNKVEIDFITLRNAVVVSHNNNKINGIVTYNQYKMNKDNYLTHLTYHYTADGEYVIEHEVFESKDSNKLGSLSNDAIYKVFSYDEVANMMHQDDKGNITYKVSYNSTKPFFQHIRPNITNNFDIESPLGISVFANELDKAKAADTKYTATEREVVQNKTRIMVNSEWLKTKAEDDEETGAMQFIKYYDENDDAIMGIPAQDDEKLMEFYQGQFRLEPLEMSLENDVKRFGWGVGLGNYFSYTEEGVYQNEANVLHSNSVTWKNKVKHETLIEEALVEMVHSIMELEYQLGNISLNQLNALKVDIMFDDSLVQDDTSRREKLKELADDGYIPKWKVVKEELGVDEATAKGMVNDNN